MVLVTTIMALMMGMMRAMAMPQEHEQNESYHLNHTKGQWTACGDTDQSRCRHRSSSYHRRVRLARAWRLASVAASRARS